MKLMHKLLNSVNFAAKKHTTQRRKNPEKSPYIEHPIGVAFILADCGVEDVDVLIGAVLHDVIEDTNCGWDELSKNFDERVIEYVREVTDDKSLPKDERKRLQIVHALEASLGGRLIKMADKLHNLSSFFDSIPVGWDAARVQGYFVWSKKVVTNCMKGETTAPMIKLGKSLDDVFDGNFEIDGKIYDCIPKNVDLDSFLEKYYGDMKNCSDECEEGRKVVFSGRWDCDDQM